MKMTGKQAFGDTEDVRLSTINGQVESKPAMSESDFEKEIALLLSHIEKRDILLEEQDTLIEKRDALIEERDALIEKLKNELLVLRRKLYGHSSERYVKEDPDQLKLDFGGEDVLPEEAQAQLEVAKETISYERKRRKENPIQPVRQPLPAQLERKEEIIEPKTIAEGSKCIGEEVTEILEYTPGMFYVRRIVRKKYALPQQAGVVIGELPSLPLPKSNAGSSLLAHLLVSKYQDHLPFYRQIEMFRRQGVSIAAATINGWFSSAIDLLEPLYETLKKEILSSDYIQIDETTIPVMDKDHPGATRKGYHWIIRAPEERKLYFHYDQGSRAQRVAIDILKDFKGAVQSDGYGAYNIYENKKNILLLGCWAHARRKFSDALKNDPKRASFALEQIQLLYRLERQVADEYMNKEQIETLRKTKAYPLMRAFEQWLDTNYSQVLPKSPIGQAIAYTHNIYPRLVRYVIDGRYKIDNNMAENGVRPLALGRKNYLFCGNHEAAKKTATIYSLLGTCKINNINPNEWLTDVFNRIPECKVNDLKKLLPDQWRKDHEEV
jgi:transposase